MEGVGRAVLSARVVCDADEMTQLTRQENVFVLDISDSPEGDHRFTYERMRAIDAALTQVESRPGS